MATKPSQRSSKLTKFLLIVGLVALPLPIMVLWAMLTRTKYAVWIVLFSKYARLYPYIMAQAKHETTNFTSKVYRIDHNLFGMKEATQRKTTRDLSTRGLLSPEGGYYAHYTNNVQSVRDQLLYLDAKQFPTSVRDEKEFVDQINQRGYFGYNATAQAQAIYLNGLKNYL